MNHQIDIVSKIFMTIQIIITASVIPVGAVYIHTVYDFNNVIYGAAGLMLITNIDNFFAELFKLQIEKNHKEVLSQENFLHFECCQTNSDVAYWWVIFLTVLNIINSFMRSLINKYMICPNIEDLKVANELGEPFYSSLAMKVLQYVNISLLMIELFFILFPFITIPLVKYFVSFGRKSRTKKVHIEKKSSIKK